MFQSRFQVVTLSVRPGGAVSGKGNVQRVFEPPHCWDYTLESLSKSEYTRHTQFVDANTHEIPSDNTLRSNGYVKGHAPSRPFHSHMNSVCPKKRNLQQTERGGCQRQSLVMLVQLHPGVHSDLPLMKECPQSWRVKNMFPQSPAPGPLHDDDASPEANLQVWERPHTAFFGLPGQSPDSCLSIVSRTTLTRSASTDSTLL